MKNIYVLFIALMIFCGYPLNAQVSVTTDGSAADPSAMLDVKSSVKGFLAPRLTETEKNNITSPASGLLIYQTTGTTGYYYYNGAAWVQLGLASGASQWSNNGGKIYYNGGNVGIGTNDPGYKLSVVGGVIQAYNNNDVCIRIGDDVTLNDFDMANGLGVYGNQDATIGHLKLGNAGVVLTGRSNRLGVGTTDPQYKLEVDGDIATKNGGDLVLSGGSGTASRLWNNTNEIVFQTQGRDMAVLNVASGLICKTQQNTVEGGQVLFQGLGANPDYYIDNYDDSGANDLRVVGGSNLKAYCNNGLNGWQTPSDERLKDNIKTLSVLDKIDMVRGASYTLNYSGETQIGVIAQEMKAAFPAVVTGDESVGMLGVDYNAVAAIALQGVKELNAKVVALEKEIAELKALINAGK